jgi:hypothetical protein
MKKNTFLVLSLLIVSSYCWHEMGHMLTARVAQYKLDTLGLNRDAFIWAQDLLAPLTDLAGEIDYPFVECAGWADKIKSLTMNQMNSWHFINIPLIDPSFQNANPEVDRNNITMQLSSFFKTLAASPKERVGRGKAILGKSMMLRFAVHMMGDIHQPLHCTNKYSSSHPTGDMGGNLVTVYFKGKKIDLHSVWDEMFNTIPQLTSPLSASSWSTMTSVTEQLFQTFGDSDPLADSLSFAQLSDYSTIAQDSFQFVGSQVYQIQDGQSLTDDYISAGAALTLKRVHQGGLRLAAFIDKAYQAFQKAHQVEKSEHVLTE